MLREPWHGPLAVSALAVFCFVRVFEQQNTTKDKGGRLQGVVHSLNCKSRAAHHSTTAQQLCRAATRALSRRTGAAALDSGGSAAAALDTGGSDQVAMAHAIQIDATTTLNLPHALDAAETRYLQALKASLSRDDAVQVVAAPPNADPGAVGALFLALERPLVYATDGTASSERAASAMRASGCEVAVLASRRRACAGEEALGSSKSDFEVLRRAAGRKGEEVSMKRRKLDKCAYAQARRRADATDVVLLDARLLLDPRKRLTLPATSVVLFDDSVDVEGLARQLASVHVNDALLERADRECARLDRKASKLAGDCNKDYVKIAEGQATPPSIECGACGLKSVVDGAPEECRVPGDCRRAHHFLRRVRAFIKHLRKKRPTSSSKAFLLELAEMLSAETLAAFPRRLASLRNALASRGAGPRASALDEVCAFARLVTRVPAVCVDGVHLSCLDGRAALDELRFAHQLIVSATCAAEVVARLLKCEPPEAALATSRGALPVVVARGADQLALTTGQGALRHDPTQARNYGTLIADVSDAVPDNVVCVFPTQEDLESCLVTWDATGAISKILQKKLVTCAVGDESETSKALEVFCRCADRGRGAVFFCSAGSPALSAAIGSARTVVFAGVPLEPMSEAVRARLDRALCDLQLRESDHLSARAALMTRGALSRAEAVVLADTRFARAAHRNHLPVHARKAALEGAGAADAAVSALRAQFRRGGNPGGGMS